MTLDELLEQFEGAKFVRLSAGEVYSAEYVEWLEGKLGRLLVVAESAREAIRCHRYAKDRPYVDDQLFSFRRGYNDGLERATAMMLDAFIEATRRESQDSEPVDRLTALERRLPRSGR